jgi:hypothetical protein
MKNRKHESKKNFFPSYDFRSNKPVKYFAPSTKPKSKKKNSQ